MSVADGQRRHRMGELLAAWAREIGHASRRSKRRSRCEPERDALESDLVYERYLGQAEYRFRLAKHKVRVSGMAGSIRGDGAALRTVLARRFPDAARLGQVRHRAGRRRPDVPHVVRIHVSRTRDVPGCRLGLGYRHREARPRVSTGITYNPGSVFLTVGFPLNTDEFRAVFTMGLRFPAPPAGIRKH